MAYKQVLRIAGQMSAGKERKAVAPLAGEITGMLRQLGMPHARFETRISSLQYSVIVRS